MDWESQFSGPASKIFVRATAAAPGLLSEKPPLLGKIIIVDQSSCAGDLVSSPGAGAVLVILNAETAPVLRFQMVRVNCC